MEGRKGQGKKTIINHTVHSRKKERMKRMKDRGKGSQKKKDSEKSGKKSH